MIQNLIRSGERFVSFTLWGITFRGLYFLSIVKELGVFWETFLPDLF
jgi:hypothetical protein